MKLTPRRRILETATRLFYEQGFNATGINQILKESATAKASFYDSYGSKEELGRKVLRHYQAGTLRWLRGIIQTSSNLEDFIQKMSASVRKQIIDGEGAYQGCPIALFSAQFPLKTGLYRCEFGDFVRTWEKVLIIFLQKQPLSMSDSQRVELTKRIFNIYEGSLIMWQLSGDIHYIEVFEQQLQESFANF